MTFETLKLDRRLVVVQVTATSHIFNFLIHCVPVILRKTEHLNPFFHVILFHLARSNTSSTLIQADVLFIKQFKVLLTVHVDCP